MNNRNEKIQFYWSRKDENELKNLINTYAPRGSYIWDPFLGSGSTLYSIDFSKYKFIGNELNQMPFESVKFNINKYIESDIEISESKLKKFIEIFNNLYTYILNDKKLVLDKIIFADNSYNLIKEVRFSTNKKNIKYTESEIPEELKIQITNRYSSYKKIVSEFDTPFLSPNSRIAIKEGMKISDIFSPINFYILISIKKEVVNDEILKNILSSVLHLTRLTDTKSQSQFPYWVPKLNVVDRNIFNLLTKQFEKFKNNNHSKKSIKICDSFNKLDKTDVYLFNLPTQNIVSEIPDFSVDVILTDPPYYDQVAYSEYLKIWEFFLEFNSNLKDEIVVSNSKQYNKNTETYLNDMSKVFNILGKKLKNNGKLLMYFKDSNLKKVEEIKKIINSCGLSFTEQIHISSKIHTYKQNTSQETSLNGNNILIFTKVEGIERKKEDTNSSQKSIINQVLFIKQLVTGHLIKNESCTLIELMNYISELHDLNSDFPEFKNSKTVFEWLNTFLKYEPNSRHFFLKPNYNFENNLLLGDSLNVLKKLSDNSIDACITDPPYNIEGQRNKEIGWYKSNSLWKESKNFNKFSESWDNFSNQSYEDFTVSWLMEIKRVVKENGNVAIFGSYHNIFKIGYLLEKLDFRIINSIVWYKRNAFPNITQRMFCESTEYIIWAANNSSKKAKNWTFNYNEMKDLNGGKQMRNMWDIPSTPSSEKKEGKHPSQKPLAVMERLIKSLSKEGDIILDPFVGSGTTSLASVKNKRKYIGIDTNLDYLITANNRIENKENLN